MKRRQMQAVPERSDHSVPNDQTAVSPTEDALAKKPARDAENTRRRELYRQNTSAREAKLAGMRERYQKKRVGKRDGRYEAPDALTLYRMSLLPPLGPAQEFALGQLIEVHIGRVATAIAQDLAEPEKVVCRITQHGVPADTAHELVEKCDPRGLPGEALNTHLLRVLRSRPGWQLFRTYAEPEGLKAVDKLILSNGEVLVKFAFRITSDRWTALDIIQEGNLGIMWASLAWSVRSGIKFEDFAIPRIRGAIADYLRRSPLRDMRVPRRDARRIKKLGEAEDKLIKQLGRKPEEQELAEYIFQASNPGVDLGTGSKKALAWLRNLVELRQRAMQPSPLQAPHGQRYDADAEEEADWEESHADLDSPSAWERLAHLGRNAFLNETLSRLEKRDQQLLSFYFLQELTYEELAEIMEISPSRACQLVWRAVDRLRFILSKDFM